MNDRTEKIRLIVEETLNEGILGAVGGAIASGARSAGVFALGKGRDFGRSAAYAGRVAGRRLNPVAGVRQGLQDAHERARMSHIQYEKDFILAKAAAMGGGGAGAAALSQSALHGIQQQLQADPVYRSLGQRVMQTRDAIQRARSEAAGMAAAYAGKGLFNYAVTKPLAFARDMAINYGALRPLQLAAGADPGSGSIGIGRGVGPAQVGGDLADFARMNR